MNDPQVVALRYRIDHGNTIDYSEAKPLAHEESGFRLRVEDRKVKFELKEDFAKDFATEEQAREALAKYIRAWEFDATLKYGNSDSFRLVFEKAEIIDRNPTPGEVRISGKGEAQFAMASPVILTTVVHEYPSPPSGIALNPDAETMHQRYLGYRGGHELLPSVAYFCLSMLEDPPVQQSSERRKTSSKRKDAAEKFGIDKSVLDKVGHLSTSRGEGEARKRAGTAQPLTPKERHFLERALKAIIRRVAERAHAPDGDLPKISWSDLPSLDCSDRIFQ